MAQSQLGLLPIPAQRPNHHAISSNRHFKIPSWRSACLRISSIRTRQCPCSVRWAVWRESRPKRASCMNLLLDWCKSFINDGERPSLLGRHLRGATGCWGTPSFNSHRALSKNGMSYGDMREIVGSEAKSLTTPQASIQ